MRGLLAGAALAPLLLATPVMAATDCAEAPEPVLGLSFESRYAGSDESRSTLDEEAEAAAKAALDPLDDFIVDLATDTENMLASENTAERREIADCILGRMAAWAEADALSSLGTQTVELTIGSRLSAFAIMLWQVAPEATTPRATLAVEAWLTRRMEEQMRFWETAPDGARQGNLRAWSALAGAALALRTRDSVVRGWAGWSVAYVVCTANEDGSLPQEMSRGKYALHYQLHALAPLVTASAILGLQGYQMDDRCDGALGRAVSYALSDIEDGARTEAITGEAQSLFEDGGSVEPFELAWIEAWLEVETDPAAEAIAAPLRPLEYSKLGGNQTLIWGH